MIQLYIGIFGCYKMEVIVGLQIILILFDMMIIVKVYMFSYIV